MKRKVCLGALVVMLLLSVGCARKQLFLVTPYGSESPRVQAMERAITLRFRYERIPYDLIIFNMNTRERPTKTWGEEMAKSVEARVKAYDPDVVFVAGDDVAHHFAQRIINKPWRIIFFEVKGNPADYYFTVSANATGVHEKVAVQETYDLIKQVAPAARRVGVIADKSLEGKAVVKQILAVQDTVLQVTEVIEAGTLVEWLAGVRKLQDNADALIVASYGSVLRKEGDRFAVPPAELLQMTSQANRLPDFSFWEEAVGSDGVMAAVTVPISAQADLAGEMGVRSLAYGTDIFNIRIASPRERARIVDARRAGALGVKVPGALLSPSRKKPRRKANLVERLKGLFRSDTRPAAID